MRHQSCRFVSFFFLNKIKLIVLLAFSFYNTSTIINLTSGDLCRLFWEVVSDCILDTTRCRYEPIINDNSLLWLVVKI